MSDTLFGSQGDVPQTNTKLSSGVEKYEGAIRMEDLVPGNITTTISYSPQINIGGFQWKIAVSKKTVDGVDQLAIGIRCNSDLANTLWSCSAKMQFRLLSSRIEKEETMCHIKEVKQSFKSSLKSCDIQNFIEWSKLISDDFKYLKDGRFTVRAHITVENIVGVYNMLETDFLATTNELSDVTLTVQGQEIHVSKAYLAMHSTYFATMFGSDFKEKQQDTIELKDVVFEEFVELLRVIYPCKKDITDKNLEFLLKLADLFDMRSVIRDCEKFLISTHELTVQKKLLLADMYWLSTVQESCLKSLASSATIKEVSNSEEYKNYNDITKAALLEKLLTLV